MLSYPQVSPNVLGLRVLIYPHPYIGLPIDVVIVLATPRVPKSPGTPVLVTRGLQVTFPPSLLSVCRLTQSTVCSMVPFLPLMRMRVRTRE